MASSAIQARNAADVAGRSSRWRLFLELWASYAVAIVVGVVVASVVATGSYIPSVSLDTTPSYIAAFAVGIAAAAGLSVFNAWRGRRRAASAGATPWTVSESAMALKDLGYDTAEEADAAELEKMIKNRHISRKS